MLRGILLASKIRHLPPRDHRLPADILACGYSQWLLAPMAVSNGLLGAFTVAADAAVAAAAAAD